MADQSEKRTGAAGPAVAERPERRAGPRYATTADTEVEEVRTQAKVIGRTTDLGMGGCYVDGLTTFPVGTRVQVRIRRAGQVFETAAKVLYGKPGMGMGLAFLDISPDDHARLEQWTRELSGETDPSPKPEGPHAWRVDANDKREVLSELIKLLVRRQVLTQSEGEDLQRGLEKQRS